MLGVEQKDIGKWSLALLPSQKLSFSSKGYVGNECFWPVVLLMGTSTSAVFCHLISPLFAALTLYVLDNAITVFSQQEAVGGGFCISETMQCVESHCSIAMQVLRPRHRVCFCMQASENLNPRQMNDPHF